MGNVQLDSVHFEQALVSLVTNAVQASEKGQLVSCGRRTTARNPWPDGDSRWKDHGVGIPRELHHKIFLPYFTTKPDGNGIGLAMANKVVRLHGGELKVESEPGKGQPVRCPDARAYLGELTSMPNVLVIDDEDNLSYSLQLALKRAGHTCRVADRIAAGLAECNRQLPDLILLDVQLPDGNGIDLMAKLAPGRDGRSGHRHHRVRHGRVGGGGHEAGSR